MPCLRRETAFSPESFSEAGSCDLIVVCSVLLRGEVQIIAGVLEPAYYRAVGDGQAFPTGERYRV